MCRIGKYHPTPMAQVAPLIQAHGTIGTACAHVAYTLAYVLHSTTRRKERYCFMIPETDRKPVIPPYGGTLQNLLATEEERPRLLDEANYLRSIQLSARTVCDLELLATGAFSPLDRFLGKNDYEHVLETMRLGNGMLFPIPITLAVDTATLTGLNDSNRVVLRDSRNNILALLTIAEQFERDLTHEARQTLGTIDSKHPLVSEMITWGTHCLSGELTVLNLPHYVDFTELRHTPAQIRAQLGSMPVDPNADRPYRPMVAFQTRNPLHRIHEELTKRAADAVGGVLLIHPVVGMTRPGDIDHYTRVRIYRSLVESYYDPGRTLLSLLPLAMRMAGPREALWHAIIRRNYGATHFIVGRDHAGPGNDSTGKPFYGPYDAQELVQNYAHEIDVTPVSFQELVYLIDRDEYVEATNVPKGAQVATISGTQVRDEYLATGKPLPEWFTRKETAQILAQMHPARHQQGFCVWFTGLSGAGKSTIAEMLTTLLLEYGRQVTLLDGDIVRTHLSKGLGFSQEDRDTNILRIGFVASEVVRHHGVAVCAAISPYRATRDENRKRVGDDRFIEVFVDTPIEVCEQRDTKGMYARARRGEITGFTGIDDPYEPPIRPEITIQTTQMPPAVAAQTIIGVLKERGFLA